MGVIVQRGPWKGHQIRKGRKTHKCVDCKKFIPCGAHYLEVEVDPDEAGGFGMKKICMCCAGDEAAMTIDYQASNRVRLADARRLGVAVDDYCRFDQRELLAAYKAEKETRS